MRVQHAARIGTAVRVRPDAGNHRRIRDGPDAGAFGSEQSGLDRRSWTDLLGDDGRNDYAVRILVLADVRYGDWGCRPCSQGEGNHAHSNGFRIASSGLPLTVKHCSSPW